MILHEYALLWKEGIIIMRKAGKLFLLLLALCALLIVSAFASGEPSAEPSGEMEASASAEPSGEPSGEPSSFEITILLNGEEYDAVSIGITVEENVYTFDVSELFSAFGIVMSYDEDSDVAEISAEEGSLMAVMLTQMTDAAVSDGADAAAESAPAEKRVPALKDAPIPKLTEPAVRADSPKTLPASAREHDLLRLAKEKYR